MSLLTEIKGLIRWSICMTKYQRNLAISFSWTLSCLCIYRLSVWWNLDILHNSQSITFPIQSCILLYFIYASLLHSLLIWLTDSSLKRYNLFGISLLIQYILFIYVFTASLGCYFSYHIDNTHLKRGAVSHFFVY